MTCAWKELLAVLPMWIRTEADQAGAEDLQELRLRINSPPELVLSEKSIYMNRNVTQEDIDYTVNAASNYSPWAAATVARGFLTAAGGHRIGICGETVIQGSVITGIKNITSLCIRIAKDFPGIAGPISQVPGSILILGPPGWGKTTLLRDLIRQMGVTEKICVIDERKELFPEGLPGKNRVDVLTGCPKQSGISMLIRTMGPSCIAVDEITEPEDTQALLQAANCGVRLLATAHASSVLDFQRRSIYRPLWDNQIFNVILVLQRDKSYTMERMTKWVTNGLVQY